jgi:hypothetical protein
VIKSFLGLVMFLEVTHHWFLMFFFYFVFFSLRSRPTEEFPWIFKLITVNMTLTIDIYVMYIYIIFPRDLNETDLIIVEGK